MVNSKIRHPIGSRHKLETISFYLKFTGSKGRQPFDFGFRTPNSLEGWRCNKTVSNNFWPIKHRQVRKRNTIDSYVALQISRVEPNRVSRCLGAFLGRHVSLTRAVPIGTLAMRADTRRLIDVARHPNVLATSALKSD